MKLRFFGSMLFAAVVFVAGSTVFAAQFTTTVDVVTPSERFTSPGYTPNGSITVHVTDGPDCTGTYTVGSVPVPNSAPNGSTPPNTTVITYI